MDGVQPVAAPSEPCDEDVAMVFSTSIENFEYTSEDPICSEVHVFAGFKWKMVIFPRGQDAATLDPQPNAVSVYLKCNGPAEGTNSQIATKWNKKICFKLILYGQGHSGPPDIVRECYGSFTESSPNWGVRSFTRLSSMKERYMVNGTIRLGAALRNVEEYDAETETNPNDFEKNRKLVLKAPMRLAVLGKRAWEYRPALIDLANRGLVEIVGCWDNSKKCADAMAQIYACKLAHGRVPATFGGDSGLEDLLHRSDVDAVISAHLSNRKHTLMCINAGKHVLADMMTSAKVLPDYKVQHREAALCVLNWSGFEPALRDAAYEVRSSCVQVLTVNVTLCVPFKKPRINRFGDSQVKDPEEPQGDVVASAALHMAPLQQLLGAKITGLSMVRATKPDSSPPTDTLNLILRFGGAFNASMAVTGGPYKSSSLHIAICGTEGDVELRTKNENGRFGYNVTVQGIRTRTRFYEFSFRRRLLESFVMQCQSEAPGDPMDLYMLSPDHALAQQAALEMLRKAKQELGTKLPDLYDMQRHMIS